MAEDRRTRRLRELRPDLIAVVLEYALRQARLVIPPAQKTVHWWTGETGKYLDATFAEVEAQINGLRAVLDTEGDRQMKLDSMLSLHRCTICGTRWLLWPDTVHGGGWNLLDKWQRPGSCCDNAAMDKQIEHLRDIPLFVPRADTEGDQPTPPQVRP